MKRALQGFIAAIGMITLFGCQDGGNDSSFPSLYKSSGWKATLNVSVPDSAADGGVVSNRLVAGGDEAATNEFDHAGDVRALLYSDAPVQAYFTHLGDPGYDANSQQLWQDLRALILPAEWEIEVLAQSGRTVTLSWIPSGGEATCATHQFTLWDADGILPQTDLCAAGLITYTGDGRMRHFVLRVS